MEQEKNFKRLVIIAYRLPFKFVKGANGYHAIQNSGGLVSAILALSEKFKQSQPECNNKIVWIGVPDELPDDVESISIDNDNFDVVPVAIPKALNKHYYGGFCNNLIWPLFHYFPSFSVFDASFIDAYREANQLFAQAVNTVVRPDDFVWVHDYQLLLLPEMIRLQYPKMTLGFFLHIPFPSFEIFRLLPRSWREELLRGMLGADVVGFHTHDYMQYFIKSVKRTLGYDCRQNYIHTPSKTVKADAFPIGIDFAKFHLGCVDALAQVEKAKIRKELPNQKLIFSVDRLDYTKGLLYRLRGYEQFLENCPHWHGRTVFNMVVVPSRDSIDKYKEMKTEIESTVGRINGRFSSLSWRPIIYQYKSLTFSELTALYDLSDVGLITPLRDGMNLVAKEYVACQRDNEGVLILSEMTGAAAELQEAIVINPFDTHELADAIVQALEMSDTEKHQRLSNMQQRIANYDVFAWANDFFTQTIEMKQEQNEMNNRLLNNSVIDTMLAVYQKSIKRIFFLDYDGTLVPFAKYPELAVIAPQTRAIIQSLAQNPLNQVVIISGRDKTFLEKQFEGIAVCLVAEHGYFIKNASEGWKTSSAVDLHWKNTVRKILLQYVNRCNGTFIEEKEGSIAWHYRNADAEFVQLRLNELRDDLREVIHHKTDFDVLDGHKVLEVKSRHYDKGQAALSFMMNTDYEFVFAAGDDKTDEYLFRALPSNAFTVRIGLHTSAARFNVADYTAIVQFLDFLNTNA